MLRTTLAVVSLLLLLRPAPSHALFHLAVIDEVNAKAGNVAGQQYVEIRMLAGAQDLVSHSRLSVFNCDGTFGSELLVLPTNLPNTATPQRWIMATSTPAAGGVTPDFIIPAGLPTTCGMVCWGAPGLLPPTDPTTWNKTNPANYVDCLAYGGFTGTPPTLVGTPNPDSAGNGAFSLQRVSMSNNNAADFAFACPTPINFTLSSTMGSPGDFGPCTPPTTTTSSTSTTTTSTSLPALLSGKTLKLSVKVGDDSKKKLTVQSKDPATDLGGGNGSADDPVLHGATLRIVSGSAAGAFDTTYQLMGSWSYIGKVGQNKGYKWKSKLATITAVMVKPGKLAKATGKGAGLGHDLDDDPNPVGAVLTLGGRTSCMSFGGVTKFVVNKSFSAKDAPTPGACP